MNQAISFHIGRALKTWIAIAAMTTLCHLILPRAVAQEIWPHFLGTGSDTTSSNVPRSWSPREKIAWRIPIDGRGRSSPVVWGKQLFVTSSHSKPEIQQQITAVSIVDGSTLWKVCTKSDESISNEAAFAGATPTPCVDGSALYALFETGDMIAVSHDGAVRWRRSLAKTFGSIRSSSGLTASLAQDEANIFALVEHDGESYLVAIHKSDGEVNWRSLRPSQANGSSPVVASLDGIPQVIVSSSGSVDSYDAIDGERLWRVEGLSGNRIPTPFVTDDGLVLVGAIASGKGAELMQAHRSNLAVRPKRHGADWHVELAWQTHCTASFASPIAHGGLGFWLDPHGNLTCVDLQDGQELYMAAMPEPCVATPVVAGNHLLVPGQSGLTTVLRIGPTFQLVAENRAWDRDETRRDLLTGQGTCEVGDPTRADHPWIQHAMIATGTSIYIRSTQEVICVRDERRAENPDGAGESPR